MVRFTTNQSRMLASDAVAGAYGADPRDKGAYPIWHPKLNQIPRAYVTVCGHDTLRDDGRIFAQAMIHAGCVVQFLRRTDKY